MNQTNERPNWALFLCLSIKVVEHLDKELAFDSEEIGRNNGATNK